MTALLEIDVTLSRERLKEYKSNRREISFNAWLIKVISHTIGTNKSVAGFLKGRRKIIVFDHVNVSFLIEKEINGERIPLPVLIEKANTLDIENIARQLNESKKEKPSQNQIVIQKEATPFERLYYYLPAFFRRAIWRYMLRHPKTVFSKMGNVAITSLGMYGKINGWFIPISIHPICFGIGSIVKKPVVLDDKIEIREVLNMTVLFDHDVIDGANATRFMKALIRNIEDGAYL